MEKRLRKVEEENPLIRKTDFVSSIIFTDSKNSHLGALLDKDFGKVKSLEEKLPKVPADLVETDNLSAATEVESEFTNEFGENIEQASVRMCAENDNSAERGFREETELIFFQIWDYIKKF